MLVTFREHAAPNLCIFHTSVTIDAGRRGAADFGARIAVSGSFSDRYECHAGLWYLKC
jgi:hypothetical protein